MTGDVLRLRSPDAGMNGEMTVSVSSKTFMGRAVVVLRRE